MSEQGGRPDRFTVGQRLTFDYRDVESRVLASIDSGVPNGRISQLDHDTFEVRAVDTSVNPRLLHVGQDGEASWVTESHIPQEARWRGEPMTFSYSDIIADRYRGFRWGDEEKSDDSIKVFLDTARALVSDSIIPNPLRGIQENINAISHRLRGNQDDIGRDRITAGPRTPQQLRSLASTLDSQPNSRLGSVSMAEQFQRAQAQQEEARRAHQMMWRGQGSASQEPVTFMSPANYERVRDEVTPSFYEFVAGPAGVYRIWLRGPHFGDTQFRDVRLNSGAVWRSMYEIDRGYLLTSDFL